MEKQVKNSPSFTEEKQVKKSPFFAQLLEKQIQNEAAVKGGNIETTVRSKDVFECLKYPSDADETIII